jgi:heptosyltransferase-2
MIDEPEGAKTLGMPFTRIYGQGAEREAAVIAQCQLLTGNDSGMAHLSASLEVPTLVLCGPTDGRKIFEWYKKAHWMDGPLPCAGCYFYGENGWSEECQHGCLSILQIGVEDVFRRCIEILHA